MSEKTKTVALHVFVVAVGFGAIILATGGIYEQVERARDRECFPQIGRSVDIGGRSLNIYRSGTGQPAIILESGATWPFYHNPKAMFENGAPHPGYSWVSIQRELAKDTTACWYDRAGSGWSDLGPYPRDSASQARDLHALLSAAIVPPPYILVAESSAALDARVFTAFYPGDVAGLVLVDGVSANLLNGAGPRARIPGLVGHSQDIAAHIFNQVGFFRLKPMRPAPVPPNGMTPRGMEYRLASDRVLEIAKRLPPRHRFVATKRG